MQPRPRGRGAPRGPGLAMPVVESILFRTRMVLPMFGMTRAEKKKSENPRHLS